MAWTRDARKGMPASIAQSLKPCHVHTAWRRLAVRFRSFEQPRHLTIGRCDPDCVPSGIGGHFGEESLHMNRQCCTEKLYSDGVRIRFIHISRWRGTMGDRTLIHDDVSASECIRNG